MAATSYLLLPAKTIVSTIEEMLLMQHRLRTPMDYNTKLPTNTDARVTVILSSRCTLMGSDSIKLDKITVN
jgi:hypothetical protein